MDRNTLMDNMVIPPRILEQLRLTPQQAAELKNGASLNSGWLKGIQLNKQ